MVEMCAARGVCLHHLAAANPKRARAAGCCGPVKGRAQHVCGWERRVVGRPAGVQVQGSRRNQVLAHGSRKRGEGWGQGVGGWGVHCWLHPSPSHVFLHAVKDCKSSKGKTRQRQGKAKGRAHPLATLNAVDKLLHPVRVKRCQNIQDKGQGGAHPPAGPRCR